MPGAFEQRRELQRRLPAEAHDHALDAPLRRSAVDDVAMLRRRARRRPMHVFFGERLEEEPVAGVVVGRDGLGVAVDHHGLVSRLRESANAACTQQ